MREPKLQPVWPGPALVRLKDLLDLRAGDAVQPSHQMLLEQRERPPVRLLLPSSSLGEVHEPLVSAVVVVQPVDEVAAATELCLLRPHPVLLREPALISELVEGVLLGPRRPCGPRAPH